MILVLLNSECKLLYIIITTSFCIFELSYSFKCYIFLGFSQMLMSVTHQAMGAIIMQNARICLDTIIASVIQDSMEMGKSVMVSLCFKWINFSLPHLQGTALGLTTYYTENNICRNLHSRCLHYVQSETRKICFFN